MSGSSDGAMPVRPLPPIDKHAKALRVGDMVLIPTMPEWLVHDLSEIEVERLRALEGSMQRISAIDAGGYLWFGNWFCLRPDDVIRSG